MGVAIVSNGVINESFDWILNRISENFDWHRPYKSNLISSTILKSFFGFSYFSFIVIKCCMCFLLYLE